MVKRFICLQLVTSAKMIYHNNYKGEIFQNPMTIRFFEPNQENGYLSNFSDHSFYFNALHYQTVEHFYQAHKFAQTDPLWAEQIRLATTPEQAKEMGRDLDHRIFESWETIKTDLMRAGVLNKFHSHSDITNLLIGTNNQQIVFSNQRDYYWGIGNGNGSNKMGKILVETRNLMRAHKIWKKDKLLVSPIQRYKSTLRIPKGYILG